MRILGILVVALFVDISTTRGVVSTVVLTGDGVPGILGARFNSFGLAGINAESAGIFTAALQQGFGGVNSENDAAVLKFDENGLTLLAREGASAPAVMDATFSSFSQVAVDDQGNALVRGTMAQTGGITASNNQGLWQFASGGDVLLARTGSQNVPGIPSASFNVLPIDGTAFSGGGRTAFSTLMTTDGSSVVSTNDRGLWSYQNGAGILISREGTSPVPGVPAATFNNYGVPAMNDNNQLVVSGILNTTAGVTASNRNGIWKFADHVGTLLARTGMSDAPGLGGGSFSQFVETAINNAGQVALHAVHSPAIQTGLWLYSENGGVLLARSSAGGVPNISDANFMTFQNPLLSDSADLFFIATLEQGTGDVNGQNYKGIWRMKGTTDDRLFMRTGSGNVPGVPGANFLDFSALAVNEVGSLVVSASLEGLAGGVTTQNDSGLWLVDPAGSGTLIAREGDSLAGRTIQELSFLGNSGGSDGRSAGFNTSNKVAFHATFTNGDAGLFLYSPDSTETSPGDFDFDDDVDGRDFLLWQRGGSPASFSPGDLAEWQEEYGPGPLTTALHLPPSAMELAVPEPTVWSLLAVVMCLSAGRTQGQLLQNC